MVPGTVEFWKQTYFYLHGILGPEHYISDKLELELDGRSNYLADYGSFQTSKKKIFTAGDCRRGQSLIVRAIDEGRLAAEQINTFLDS